jgi:hypothetical protein
MPHLEPVVGSDVYLWQYLPAIAPAAVSLGLFAALTAITICQLVRTKTFFCIALVVGGVCKCLRSV